jgi:hypothetical protein
MGNMSADRSQALLYYLAVTGHLHSWEKLAGLLWGDKPEDSAKVNLRKSLSNLRQLFGVALIVRLPSTVIVPTGWMWQYLSLLRWRIILPQKRWNHYVKWLSCIGEISTSEAAKERDQVCDLQATAEEMIAKL